MIPYGFCHCGCREKTRLAERNNPALGWVKGQPKRFIHNHHARLQEPKPLDRYVVEDRGHETPCWIWQGYVDPNGYGQIGRNKRAHRVVYEALCDPIPAGLELDHLCRVPTCVNPSHLEPVTRAENNRRSMSVSALNIRKTHCVNGHPLEGDNLYVHPASNSRRCKECHRVAERRRRDRLAVAS